MAAASLDLGDGWRAERDGLVARLGRLFVRPEPRRQAARYIEALLSDVARKNGWQLAEQIGDPRPWRTQRVLSHVLWDEEAARDLCRAYVVEHLGDEDAALVATEACFAKKGERSAGIARQYNAASRRIENCQLGIFLAYAGRRGQALIDRRLYLPESWIHDTERRRAARIPDQIGFLSKPAIARSMIVRALDAGVPCRWVLGGTAFAADRPLHALLEEHGTSYLFAIQPNERLGPVLGGRLGQDHRPERLAGVLPQEAWQQVRPSGEGQQSPYRWVRLRLSRAPQGGPAHDHSGGWDRWLLMRRGPGSPGRLACFIAFARSDTPLASLARVARLGRAGNHCIEAARQEVGLADYEVRSWHSWHRHVTLAMLAWALLAAHRAAPASEPPHGAAGLSQAPLITPGG